MAKTKANANPHPSPPPQAMEGTNPTVHYVTFDWNCSDKEEI